MKKILWVIFIFIGFHSAASAQTNSPVYLTGGHLVDVIRGEIGKQAAIVAIGGNPLTDIRSAYNVETVVKGGRVYQVEELKNSPRRK